VYPHGTKSVFGIHSDDDFKLFETIEERMTGDALERAKEKAWAHKEALKGVRRNTDGERYLCGLSVGESTFLIECEARHAAGAAPSREDREAYAELHRRHEAKRIADYSRRIQYVAQHWRRSFRAHGGR
jgi:hypothetical protein